MSCVILGNWFEVVRDRQINLGKGFFCCCFGVKDLC